MKEKKKEWKKGKKKRKNRMESPYVTASAGR
jgi:hypothetical protein